MLANGTSDGRYSIVRVLSRPKQRIVADSADPEGNNNGARDSANKAPQAEEPFDTLRVHKAAEQSDISRPVFLVHSVEEMDNYDTYGVCTPLHLAIQGDHAKAVKILLKAETGLNKLDYSDIVVDLPNPALDLAA